VPDHKPPRPLDDERTTTLALLQFHRESFLRNLDGISDEDARHTMVDSGTSLLWLAKHLAFAEDIWLVRRFAGQPGVNVDNTLGEGDTVDGVVAAYREGWTRVDAIVAAAPDLEGRCEPDAGPPVNLRWILLHLIGETARHAGHADILREQIDGTTGR